MWVWGDDMGSKEVRKEGEKVWAQGGEMSIERRKGDTFCKL